MTIQFNMSGTGSSKPETIDLSQCASMLNRRFYRQGLEWAVAGFTMLSATGTTGEVLIRKLPDTWMCDNAYTKAYHAWKRQQDDAVEDAGAESAVARYRDFKIFADLDHHSAGFANNLLPSGFSVGAGNTGEWEASTIVIPNYGAPGVNYEPFLSMVGDDVGGAAGSKGLIKGYENSRAYPHSPDPVSPDIGSTENWFQQMFDVGDNFEDVLDNATDRNDDLPYDQDNYPGANTITPNMQLHDYANITGTTIGGKTSMSGSNFKCGLVRIEHSVTAGSNNLICLLHLVPGNHRGYLAERMT